MTRRALSFLASMATAARDSEKARMYINLIVADLVDVQKHGGN